MLFRSGGTRRCPTRPRRSSRCSSAWTFPARRASTSVATHGSPSWPEAVIRSAGDRPDRAALEDAVRGFEALPHRLQFVGTHAGMRCYNDSKSTTPEATLLAVGAFPDPAHIHLIAGGYDKKVDLSAVRDLAPRLAGLYAIGATEDQLAPAPPAVRCRTLDAAVRAAADRARPGDVLLLSPACASFGQFTNYEHRGDAFTALVRAL